MLKNRILRMNGEGVHIFAEKIESKANMNMNIKFQMNKMKGWIYVLKKKAYNQNYNQFDEQLLCATSKFIGSCAISASIASSPQMHEFITSIVDMTQIFVQNNPNTNLKASSIIKQFNPHEIKQFLIRMGNECFKDMIYDLQQYKYVNLMLDAATVLNQKFVHCTINSPYSDRNPVPLRTTIKEVFDWNQQNYKEEIQKAIEDILRNNLIPIAICHDRLPAQSLGIRKFLKENSDKIECAFAC